MGRHCVLLAKQLSSKWLWKELNSELCSELLKFEMAKILGEETSSVVFREDEEHINLLLSYAFTHVMILNINMFCVDFLHRVDPMNMLL